MILSLTLQLFKSTIFNWMALHFILSLQIIICEILMSKIFKASSLQFCPILRKQSMTIQIKACKAKKELCFLITFSTFRHIGNSYIGNHWFWKNLMWLTSCQGIMQSAMRNFYLLWVAQKSRKQHTIFLENLSHIKYILSFRKMR